VLVAGTRDSEHCRSSRRGVEVGSVSTSEIPLFECIVLVSSWTPQWGFQRMEVQVQWLVGDFVLTWSKVSSLGLLMRPTCISVHRSILLRNKFSVSRPLRCCVCVSVVVGRDAKETYII